MNRDNAAKQTMPLSKGKGKKGSSQQTPQRKLGEIVERRRSRWGRGSRRLGSLGEFSAKVCTGIKRGGSEIWKGARSKTATTWKGRNRWGGRGGKFVTTSHWDAAYTGGGAQKFV